MIIRPIHVFVRFYAELNDFLPPDRRHRLLVCDLAEHDSVKDVIESQGVPHTEVELIVVNGEPVGFEYRVGDGDRIAAYPHFRRIDISSLPALRPALDEPRFVLDTHLGTLARYLRVLGFDSLYRNDYDDETLARVAHDEGRILLTRDRGLLKRSLVTHGYHVWSTRPAQQVTEVLRRFDLFDRVAPFRRCPRCNGVVEPVPKAAVVDQLLPKTRQFYDEFGRCAACGQVYWKGPHYDHMRRLMEGWGTPPAATRARDAQGAPGG